MTASPIDARRIRSPRGWLGLAFLAVWLYLISQLLRIFPAGTADAFGLTVPEARQVLAITSGLGQIGLFAGLVAALWRANLAAGVSDTGIRGLGLGLAGVGMLTLFEIALFVDWIRVASPLTDLTRSPALDARGTRRPPPGEARANGQRCGGRHRDDDAARLPPWSVYVLSWRPATRDAAVLSGHRAGGPPRRGPSLRSSVASGGAPRLAAANRA